MRPLMAQPSPVEQVYHEILSEIVAGRLPEHARLIQDEMARDLGVSRHPVQQALLLLRNQGFVRDAARAAGWRLLRWISNSSGTFTRYARSLKGLRPVLPPAAAQIERQGRDPSSSKRAEGPSVSFRFPS